MFPEAHIYGGGAQEQGTGEGGDFLLSEILAAPIIAVQKVILGVTDFGGVTRDFFRFWWGDYEFRWVTRPVTPLFLCSHPPFVRSLCFSAVT